MEDKHVTAGKAICIAWENKNYEFLKNVLAERLEWFEGAFETPQQTPGEVIERWQSDIEQQSDIAASITAVDVVGDVSYQRCDARYTAGGVSKQLAGLFRIQLNTEGKIIRFEQWWDIRYAERADITH